MTTVPLRIRLVDGAVIGNRPLVFEGEAKRFADAHISATEEFALAMGPRT